MPAPKLRINFSRIVSCSFRNEIKIEPFKFKPFKIKPLVYR